MKFKFSILLTVFTVIFVSSCQSQPKSLSLNEFKTELNQKNSVLIDIRTPQEFASGHIEGATNINFYNKDFESQMYEAAEKANVLIYCASGNRSGQALKSLNAGKFKSISDLSGGIRAWATGGNSIIK
jgi:rhodanese-related sulfurtransferase